jgi:MYXO-CTERM domain-containing protein
MKEIRHDLNGPLVSRTYAVLLALIAFLAPATALANGNNSHLWITLQAREQLPTGELKELLFRPDVQVSLQNGASFPDGGYAIKDDYGEMAHWEPFVIAYMDWIRSHYDKPYAANPEAAVHVAFLMGIASHGLADQVYDSLFMDVARVYDAAGWSDEFLQDFDTATDVFFEEATGQNIEFDAWAPSYEISDLFLEAFQYDIGPTSIDTAQRLLASARAYTRDAAKDASKLDPFKQQYPWAYEHMMDARVPGGPPTEAAAVSAYLQVIWDRLNGEDSPEDLIIATTPANGAGGQPILASTVESQVGIVFGHAIDDSSLGPDKVVVSDAAGNHYDVELSMWRTQSNVLRLRPRADWPADTTFTVTLQPGLRSIDGLTLPSAQSFTFSTAAAATSDPLPGTVDPTPNDHHPDTAGAPLVVDEEPACACRVGGHRAGHGFALLVGALLFLLVRRRRG